MILRIAGSLMAIGIFFWAIFVYPTFFQMIHYHSFSAQTNVDSAQWSILPIHDELWKPSVKYHYHVGEKEFEGHELFLGEGYRNPYLAEESIKELERTHKKVWYSPSDPGHSTLEKFFPTKKLIYAFLTFLLLIYAVCLASFIISRLIKDKSSSEDD